MPPRMDEGDILPPPVPSLLGTTTVFDDAVYLGEALGLPVNQTEDDLDAELALLAQESGIHDPYRFLSSLQDISRALSTVTLDSDQGSSLSVRSEETQSTGFTSAPSRTSRDQVYSGERPAGPRVPLRNAPAVRAADCNGMLAIPPVETEICEQTPGCASPEVKRRNSASNMSVAQSTLSMSSSVSSLAPRRKRVSGLFGLFRRDFSSCTSRSHHGYHGKGRGPKLACGHSLSPYAIRTHIQEAQQRGQEAPACCGKPLPREVLEEVTGTEEPKIMILHAIQSPTMASSRDSGYCENSVSSVELSRPCEPSCKIATSASLPVIPQSHRRHEAINIDSALAHEAFKQFRLLEREHFEQVSTFECSQRTALSAHYEFLLKQLANQHDTDRLKKLEQHSQNLEHLEEAQILAEHDLRKAHALECQNVATALKYMEAYCLSSSGSHPVHAHIVTEEDFRKLDRQRMVQKNLPRKHENAINVLRARQERDLKTRIQKQETELDLMDADLETKRAHEEDEHKKALGKLEVLIEARRKRLMQRWDLRFEMWRRDWESEHGTFKDQLEHEEWPLSRMDTMTPISESSFALYVQSTASTGELIV